MRQIGIFILIFLGIELNAQSVETMRVNHLKLRLSSNGTAVDSAGSAGIFTDNQLSLAQSCGVWLSAKDSSGAIRIAVMDVMGNQGEFWPGPMSVQNEQSSNPNAWDKVYYVTKEDINYHKNHFNDANYSANNKILSWPGSSNPPYAKVLAPFVDFQTNDQTYKPLEGDYPYIKSEASLFSISNDGYLTHSLSKAKQLGVELHTHVMGFDSKDTVLGNCLLMRYSVFNRSDRDYKNFVFTGIINFKIGNVYNEYLGTDVKNRTLFAINDTSEATFSNQLVSLGCMAINNKIASSIYYENTSDPVNGLPTIDSHFYRLSRGLWKNGNAMRYGGNGVDASGSNAKFVYPYETDASQGSQMWSDNDRYQPGQRIGLINFDSIELKRGTAVNFDLLYFVVKENNFDIKQISENCLTIKQVLNTRNLLKTEQIIGGKGVENTLYPNPSQSGEKLMIKGSLETATNLRLLDGLGRELTELNLDNSDNSIILPNDLSNGVYYLEIKTLNTIKHNKLIINNQ